MPLSSYLIAAFYKLLTHCRKCFLSMKLSLKIPPAPFTLRWHSVLRFFLRLSTWLIEGTPDKRLESLSYNPDGSPPAVGRWQINCSELQCHQCSEGVWARPVFLLTVVLLTLVFKGTFSGMSVSHSVMSYSLWPHGPARLFCPWNSPGKNTGVGCRCCSVAQPCPTL